LQPNSTKVVWKILYSVRDVITVITGRLIEVSEKLGGGA